MLKALLKGYVKGSICFRCTGSSRGQSAITVLLKEAK